MKKRVLPKIRILEDFIELDKDSRVISQMLFNKDSKLVGISEVTEFNECVFKDLSFIDVELTKITMVDVRFENCDFSNVDLGDRSFFRVEFKNCKMIGVDFTKVHFYDCLFEGSNASYSNFSEVKFKNSEIIDSNFMESRFQAVEFSSLYLESVDFTRLEVIQSSLKGLNLCDCVIDGIRADLNSLRGVKVSSYQAIDLISLFGIIVE